MQILPLIHIHNAENNLYVLPDAIYWTKAFCGCSSHQPAGQVRHDWYTITELHQQDSLLFVVRGATLLVEVKGYQSQAS